MERALDKISIQPLEASDSIFEFAFAAASGQDESGEKGLVRIDQVLNELITLLASKSNGNYLRSFPRQ